ncbi:MAG: SPFH domain-containing protein [Candidatus Jorgensenbacteria bacterium]
MLFYIAAAAVAIILILNSIVIIPPYHFGVWSWLGHRVRGKRGILREGPHFVAPLISSVELVSMELVKKDIGFHLTTSDGFRLKAAGVFQYRPDPDVWHKNGHPDQGRNVFVTVSEDVIVDGVIESVEARLGGLGGRYGHEHFIRHRQALGDIINAILRLSTPPHLRHFLGAADPDPSWRPPFPENPDHPNNLPPSFCGLNDCEFKEREVSAERLVDFYDKHWRQVRIYMKRESYARSDRSGLEERYGIDVEVFDLGNVDFTEETQAALEEEKQAEARYRAAEKRLEVVRAYRAPDIGASPDTAVDEADLLMDPKVTKEIISVQGRAGVLGGIIAGLTNTKRR